MIAIVLASLLVCASARSIQDQPPPRCARGSAFEVYGYNPAGSFHAIMNSRADVVDAAACAALCARDDGCTCALFQPDHACSWRASSCESSEMFVDARPTNRQHGLIRVCAGTFLKTYDQCGGIGYNQAGRSCGPADACVEKNKWFSQCLPMQEN